MTSAHAPGDPGQRTDAEPWRRWTRRNLATARGERGVGEARGLSDSCGGGDRDWAGRGVRSSWVEEVMPSFLESVCG